MPANLVGEAAFMLGHLQGVHYVPNVLGTTGKTDESVAVPLYEASERQNVSPHHGKHRLRRFHASRP